MDNTNEEVWKAITCLQHTPITTYEVSTLGRIRNAKTKRIIKCGTSRAMYKNFFYGWYDENKIRHRSSMTVHRIVGKTFLENDDPENKTMIDHIDGDINNNQLYNLRWVTATENARNVHKHGKGHHTFDATKPVYLVNKNGNVFAKYDNAQEASLATGKSIQHIQNSCRNVQWKYYSWGRFTQEPEN